MLLQSQIALSCEWASFIHARSWIKSTKVCIYVWSKLSDRCRAWQTAVHFHAPTVYLQFAALNLSGSSQNRKSTGQSVHSWIHAIHRHDMSIITPWVAPQLQRCIREKLTRADQFRILTPCIYKQLQAVIIKNSTQLRIEETELRHRQENRRSTRYKIKWPVLWIFLYRDSDSPPPRSCNPDLRSQCYPLMHMRYSIFFCSKRRTLVNSVQQFMMRFFRLPLCQRTELSARQSRKRRYCSLLCI